MKTDVDRISSLPDDLLHHILSFLDTSVAFQTSALSTRWRYLFKSLPILNFDSKTFSKSLTALRNEGVSFTDFVDRVLGLRDSSSSISLFRVIHSDSYILPSNVNSWIHALVPRNIEKLHLHLNCRTQLNLPNCFFSSRSLVELKLHIYVRQGNLHLDLPDSINLPNLKKLYLSHISFMDSNLPSKLISNCPVLQSLTLDSCQINFPGDFIIFAPNLQYFTILFSYVDENFQLDNCKFKIYAPKLRSFHCLESEIFNDYHINSFSSLENARIEMDVSVYIAGESRRGRYAQRMTELLSGICTVKALTLSVHVVEFLSQHPDITKSLQQFCFLRNLGLNTCLSRENIIAIGDMLRIFPNIQTLVIEIDECMEHGRNPLLNEELKSEAAKEILEEKMLLSWSRLHHLKVLKMQNLQGSVNELRVAQVLLENSFGLENMIIFFASERTSDIYPGIEKHERERRLINFKEKLNTFPRASSSVVIDVLKYDVSMFDYELF